MVSAGIRLETAEILMANNDLGEWSSIYGHSLGLLE